MSKLHVLASILEGSALVSTNYLKYIEKIDYLAGWINRKRDKAKSKIVYDGHIFHSKILSALYALNFS